MANAKPRVKAIDREELEGVLISHRCILVIGQAGCGKTVSVVKALSGSRKRTAWTATTGLAAAQLPSGSTIHRFAGIMTGMMTEAELRQRVHCDPALITRIRGYDTLVIDEISMLSAHMLALTSVALQVAKQNATPFGGMKIILIGDIAQLEPVEGRMFYCADEFRRANFHICRVVGTARFADAIFGRFIEQLGCGAEVDMASHPVVQATSHHVPPPPLTSTYIFATNCEVDAHNRAALRLLSGSERTYVSKDNGCLSRTAAIQKKLTLKKGARVMVTMNVGTLFNGAVGIVTELDKESVQVAVDGQDYCITAATFTQHRDAGYGSGRRTGLPLRLSYAMTAHKVQGQTIDHQVCVDALLMREQRMLYVAASRVRAACSLTLLNLSSLETSASKDHELLLFASTSAPSTVMDDNQDCEERAEEEGEEDEISLPSGLSEEDIRSIELSSADCDIVAKYECANGQLHWKALRCMATESKTQKQFYAMYFKYLHSKTFKGNKLVVSAAESVGLMNRMREAFVQTMAAPVLFEGVKDNEEMELSAASRGRTRYIAGFCLKKLLGHLEDRVGGSSTGNIEKSRLIDLAHQVKQWKLTPEQARASSSDPDSLVDSEERDNARYIVHVVDGFADLFLEMNSHRGVFNAAELKANAPEIFQRHILQDPFVDEKFSGLFAGNFHPPSMKYALNFLVKQFSVAAAREFRKTFCWERAAKTKSHRVNILIGGKRKDATAESGSGGKRTGASNHPPSNQDLATVQASEEPPISETEEPPISETEEQCRVCSKTDQEVSGDWIFCDVCVRWMHRTCVKMAPSTYRRLKRNSVRHECAVCVGDDCHVEE